MAKRPNLEGPGNDWSHSFMKAMERLGVKLSCPACGHQKWSVSENADTTTTDALSIRGGERYIPAYMMACRNCGYIRLHARPIVDAALDEQCAEEPADGE